MRRSAGPVLLAVLVSAVVAPSRASAQQSINVYLGQFSPRAMDGRGANDVLYQNDLFLSTANSANGIDISQFKSVTVGAEWLFGVAPDFEGGLGVAFYQRTVGTAYSSNSRITQNLTLRIVPVAATLRWLPLGRKGPVQPYLGGGANMYVWLYSEDGQFLDAQNQVFAGTYEGSGTAVGPVLLGGVRVPVGALGVGAEVRWQGGKATLPTSEGFAGTEVDLGGFNYLLTMNIRF